MCEGERDGVGQCVLFWGNQCLHYTLPNDTDTTRVSIDFRVVPKSYYQTVYKDCLRLDGQPRWSQLDEICQTIFAAALSGEGVRARALT